MCDTHLPQGRHQIQGELAECVKAPDGGCAIRLSFGVIGDGRGAKSKARNEAIEYGVNVITIELIEFKSVFSSVISTLKHQKIRDFLDYFRGSNLVLTTNVSGKITNAEVYQRSTSKDPIVLDGIL